MRRSSVSFRPLVRNRIGETKVTKKIFQSETQRLSSFLHRLHVIKGRLLRQKEFH